MENLHKDSTVDTACDHALLCGTDDPERIQAIYDQIKQMYAMAGIGLGQKYLSQC